MEKNNIICAGLAKIRDGEFVITGILEPSDILTAAIRYIDELVVRNEKLLREREDLRMFCTGLVHKITAELNGDASDGS
jgi:hypothetical protein